MKTQTEHKPHWLSRMTINELAKLGVLKKPYIAFLGEEFLPSLVLDKTTIFIRKRTGDAATFKTLQSAKNCLTALGFSESDIKVSKE